MSRDDLGTPRFFGKYRGVVVENQDPEKRGRLRVKAPAVLQNVDANWALPCVPVALPKGGTYLIPPKGAQVWVEFEGGNPEIPIWSGCFWSPEDAPEPARPAVRMLRFGGACLAMEEQGSGSLKLLVGQPQPAASLEIDARGIELKCGGSSLKVGTGGVEIAVGGSQVKVGATQVEIRSGGAVVQVATVGNKVSVNYGALEVI
jgi:hypothetical protein